MGILQCNTHGIDATGLLVLDMKAIAVHHVLMIH